MRPIGRAEEYLADLLPSDLPEHARKAITRIYEAYPLDCLPKGICDPMYILNVMAFELGVGDGQGNFKDRITTKK